jgi:hypothetical protein
MALCVVTGRTGSLESAGEAALTNGEHTCGAGAYLLLTPSEANQQIDIPLLQLSPAEGAAISSAVLLVWAVAWAFRALIQTIKSSDGNTTNED